MSSLPQVEFHCPSLSINKTESGVKNEFYWAVLINSNFRLCVFRQSLLQHITLMKQCCAKEIIQTLESEKGQNFNVEY
jgi:hypothetical protein